ncbi:PREDICTED: protein FAM136A-like [Dufourea novaeangliae]|uniref:protein FAM136A-like n=1 Tax=Dufourea novaeangliae TaxID=178035 RepID=UPI0007671988|nr:PREDICTED: protein FAM136A-like [Dufourea novaeangliae]
MVEGQRRRVEEHMNKMVEEIDKSYLRKMQGDMHRCAATCCDSETYSIQKVHNCVENCSGSLNKAQQYVQQEFERAQNRLQRCVMDCNDKIKDKIGPSPTQNEVDRYSDEFEKCATKCVDSYCDALPALEKTMKKVLSSKKYEY